MKCEKCGQEIFLPFKCQYCGGHFCSEHRLPENHECPQIEQARMPTGEPEQIAVQKKASYEYTFVYPQAPPTTGKVFFSKTEIKHLGAAALIVLALGFSPAIYGQRNLNLLIAVSTVLIASFFLHEIAHKIVAERMRLWAEFRLTMIGALLTLLSVISSFIKIISPGAVMVSGHADTKSLGRISIVGPMTNVMLAAACIVAALLLPEYGGAFKLGAIFNGWIVVFNLIPFAMLDGLKVFQWNKIAWTLVLGAGLILLLFSFELPFSI